MLEPNVPGQPPAGYGFFSVEANGTRAIETMAADRVNATFTVYPELGYTGGDPGNYDPPSASKVTSKIRERLLQNDSDKLTGNLTAPGVFWLEYQQAKPDRDRF